LEKNTNDFYLISAKTNQGVPSPTQYTVIFDDTRASADDYQELVYKLTYLYFNWVGAVKIPAPCQLAKKLAILVGEKMSKKGDLNLPNVLFNMEIPYYL